jgi:long-subunit fatty acid transport protein
MYRIAAATTALLASTAIAQAGGLDRNQLGTGILFEQGTYLELGYSFVDPTVSGVLAAAPVPSGDMSESYGFTTLSYHHDLSETLSFSLIVDAPYGADVAYPAGGNYPFQGSRAELRSQQITAALRYELNENVSVYGGLRALALQGNDLYVSAITGTAPLSGFSYSLDAESDWEYGYMLGAAYEIPDIAMRVALTYFSEIEATLTGRQGVAATPLTAIATTAPVTFKVTMPQSVLLEAQSGIAADTLLFGSVRWTNWDGFNITPGAYPAGALVSYTDDVWTWNLGIGRRVTENLALSATVGYEAQLGGFAGQLGPTDGRLSLGLGAEYTIGNVSIAGGVQYTDIGNAQTANSAGAALANFNDNDAIAFGLRIGIQF